MLPAMLTEEQQHRLIAIWIEDANKTGPTPLVYAGHSISPYGMFLRTFIVKRIRKNPYIDTLVTWEDVRDDACVYGLWDIVEALT